ncbi:MAG: rhomboid family intramembrane serine protease [Anaerolineae bacterium]
MTSSSPPPAVRRGAPFPLGRPFWVYVLLASIAAVYLLEQTLPLFVEWLIPRLPPAYEGVKAADFAGGATNQFVLILLGANFRPFIFKGEVWRFFTSMFLHIGLQHLLFNAYALFVFGVEMERVFGRARFVTIYVLSGLAGSFASFAFSDALLSAGASGAIFGVIGMQTAFFFKYKNQMGSFGRSRLLNVAFIVGLNFAFGLTVRGIDNLAHLGGLVAGMLLGYGLAPVYQLVGLETGAPRLENRASLWSQGWVLAAAVLILAGGTALALRPG